MVETIAWAACGGVLMGLSSSALFALTGSTRGVSGMAAALLARARGERRFGGAYLLGMGSSGAALHGFLPTAYGGTSGRPLALVLLAGLLVGFGARLANGCTSGHGVLGVARGSLRSVVALAIFAITAGAVVAVFPPSGGAQ